MSSYVILELGISTELLINVVSAFEAPSVNSSRGYHMILQIPIGDTHTNNKVTLWKLQSLVEPLHGYRRKWNRGWNDVYFFSPEMELTMSEKRLSMAYDICLSS